MTSTWVLRGLGGHSDNTRLHSGALHFERVDSRNPKLPWFFKGMIIYPYRAFLGENVLPSPKAKESNGYVEGFHIKFVMDRNASINDVEKFQRQGFELTSIPNKFKDNRQDKYFLLKLPFSRGVINALIGRLAELDPSLIAEAQLLLKTTLLSQPSVWKDQVEQTILTGNIDDLFKMIAGLIATYQLDRDEYWHLAQSLDKHRRPEALRAYALVAPDSKYYRDARTLWVRRVLGAGAESKEPAAYTQAQIDQVFEYAMEGHKLYRKQEGRNEICLYLAEQFKKDNHLHTTIRALKMIPPFTPHFETAQRDIAKIYLQLAYREDTIRREQGEEYLNTAYLHSLNTKDTELQHEICDRLCGEEDVHELIPSIHNFRDHSKVEQQHIVDYSTIPHDEFPALQFAYVLYKRNQTIKEQQERIAELKVENSLLKAVSQKKDTSQTAVYSDTKLGVFHTPERQDTHSKKEKKPPRNLRYV